MDTKQLYDKLIESNISMDMDSVADAEPVWIEAIIASFEDWQDTHQDYYAEIPEEKQKKMHAWVASADHDLEYISRYGNDRGLIHAYIAAANSNMARWANACLENHREQVTKLVEQVSDTWMADCIGYDVDMNEGRSEDAAMFRADR
jgi:hypothetical protein